MPQLSRLLIGGIFSGESNNSTRMEKEGPGDKRLE